MSSADVAWDEQVTNHVSGVPSLECANFWNNCNEPSKTSIAVEPGREPAATTTFEKSWRPSAGASANFA
eukprot:CAMPEP_0203880094 /NCGR_PEP_ID=MMETSP0359-20131031/24509_1 /ASSEMBLY_ACC=CAM_ASM_000338 /TAXON_ID=268821 /ORGANISM="Scrippsiella Hangoei, Strain SHTV-5" /LENGTH=68 /DNA_ID=CAMNT_0050799651 /DNA_START=157 /DNA_END=363 /DNA_ORIENTATION=+